MSQIAASACDRADRSRIAAAVAQDKPAPSRRLAGAALEKAMADYKKKTEGMHRRAREARGGRRAVLGARRREAQGAHRQAPRAARPSTLTDYVLEQPPVYAGPPCPPDPSVQAGGSAGRQPELPVVADFLRNAKEHFGFVPERRQTRSTTSAPMSRSRPRPASPKSRWCASIASSPAATANTTCRPGSRFNKPNAKAISTALGYNQLLTANTTSLLAEKGERFVKALQARAAQLVRRGDARRSSARSKC